MARLNALALSTRSISRRARRDCIAIRESWTQRIHDGRAGATTDASPVPRMCEVGSAWLAMVDNSIRVAPGVSTLLLFLFRVARFAVTRERVDRMAFMRREHARNIFCRAECKPRTIVRRMHKFATCVTGS